MFDNQKTGCAQSEVKGDILETQILKWIWCSSAGTSPCWIILQLLVWPLGSANQRLYFHSIGSPRHEYGGSELLN